MKFANAGATGNPGLAGPEEVSGSMKCANVLV
jgi:hypothetical protein